MATLEPSISYSDARKCLPLSFLCLLPRGDSTTLVRPLRCEVGITLYSRDSQVRCVSIAVCADIPSHLHSLPFRSNSTPRLPLSTRGGSDATLYISRFTVDISKRLQHKFSNTYTYRWEKEYRPDRVGEECCGRVKPIVFHSLIVLELG